MGHDPGKERLGNRDWDLMSDSVCADYVRLSPEPLQFSLLRQLLS